MPNLTAYSLNNMEQETVAAVLTPPNTPNIPPQGRNAVLRATAPNFWVTWHTKAITGL